ncbi:glucose-1-phosphate adenylyltransferase, GlgD subunit [Anoxybacillus sp. B7M1]|jgi:glucose-1-phosphate adenylyltransferase|uniref:sugar phosphate nucleotidyltransferase n=1 Tax=Anoxybacillaceae TaxID=3120669 RepID=UPI0005CCEA02|nr:MULTISPECIES: sugar phosphate nucleotidyltransferase [Anoxybacillus]ANB56320.1 glucose-1-phosphate adenylyltransferase, GlgD subunit [Anoxybacillus sp. B2M1]ANB65082.1 glucose-1-phosphate adenylyltransferase, GlgD subunit [Anoxybacillus sp. B7M1]KXG08783.1 Glycogen biosynthesis protein GlgD [Anoxybacillus sp. P3H1B]MBB3906945.1 glucose-1-phosphate adenylyltransferase [Anoxybacillus rupiensis]OQM45486.1 glucose-1-phosphate adenylyltransferase [Anoxybacillus sp. UARK-01]
MNKTMLGVIDDTRYMESLYELTLHRSIAAIPFAGRYRLIDFVLSNMVNSGMQSIAIFPKYHYRSLMDHLGSGKNWDLSRKRDGLFFFPSSDLNIPAHHLGAFQHFEQHIDYFLRSKQKYALICNSYTVCNIDYEAVLKRHIDNQCDITEIRHQGRSLGMFVLETSLLLDLIANRIHTGYNSIIDVVHDHLHQLKICDYEHYGYVAVIDSIESYFRHSLELLNPTIWNQLFVKSRPIYTKVKDAPPTKYTENAVVKNSIVANGCMIEGHVENSIIFRAVKIEKGTVVKNSIIMQKSHIGEQCELNSVIVDKDVKVENGVKIVGSEQHPFVVRKGTVQGELMNQ